MPSLVFFCWCAMGLAALAPASGKHLILAYRYVRRPDSNYRWPLFAFKNRVAAGSILL